MNNLLAVDFSTGLAAVLLCAAAIIFVVMIAEIISARPRKVKNKPVLSAPAEERQTVAEPFEEQIKEAQPVEPPQAEISCEEEQVALSAEPPVEQIEQSAEEPKAKPVARAKSKSFSERLEVADGGVKDCYSELKDELTKRGFEGRLCKKSESFRAVKKLCARIAIRRKGLGIFCALEPENYVSSDGATEDFSDKKSYKSTPLFCAVTDGKNLEISKGLIAELEAKFFQVKVENYAVETPEKIRAKKVKKGVKKVVDVGDIFRLFEDGEEADFNEIKKRIFGNKQNITYIKVLGRTDLRKNISVTANSFSRSAEKCILDAGG
ncbi:MAG: uL15 family ribosomal protein, partial [Clostridia bacterium]|nr:uL15 family ribosomal protein [Clostridia bacterium]